MERKQKILQKKEYLQTFWLIHSCTDSLFLELEDSNFGCLLIFWFPLTVQSFRLDNIDIKYFIRVPPFHAFWFCNLPKILLKLCRVEGNQKEASSQKFEVSNSKHKNIGATISFQEGLEVTLFNHWAILPQLSRSHWVF